MAKVGYNKTETALLKKLKGPGKIQDYLNSLKFNFEKSGETCYSPRFVMRYKTAHCMEGALLAAAALEFHGRPPLVMDLRADARDFDHVVTVFKQFGCFGAISKTNHGVLRYREPIYKTLRELALSYFHEYFLNNGKKTLREHSGLLDLTYFDSHPKQLFTFPRPWPAAPAAGQDADWRISEKNLFGIPEHLDRIGHYKILSLGQIKNLRKADEIEILTGKLVEWNKGK